MIEFLPMSATHPQPPPLVMTFSASDPSGGAGLQADLLTLASLGCHALTVVTGLTLQDTSGVHEMQATDADWVEDQARLLLEDMHIAAFKIGVLGSVENIMVIAEIMADYPDIPLVLDPVLASGRGDEFADEEQRAALRELLLPQTTILTPNSIEARRLASASGDAENSALPNCAHALTALGCEYVLITGSHENTPQVCNTLYNEQGQVRSDAWPRLPDSYHGSGCTLASAIAAFLAQGMNTVQAAQEAQQYTWQTLSHGFRPGMGQHIPDRLYWARKTMRKQNA